MSKKIFMMVVFMYAITQLISPEDLFRILEDTPVWNSPPLTDSRATIIIPKGSLISSVPPPYTDEVNRIRSFAHTSILFENTRYYIAANTFTAEDTEEMFDESFLTNADPQAKIWINAYFLDVMRTGNRDILIPIEQRLVDLNIYEEQPWYEMGAFDRSLVITQGTITIGGLTRDEFWVRRIEHIPNGYCVTVTWNTRIPGYIWDTLIRSMKVHLPERKRDTVLYLYFVIDGDYLDVYYKEDIAAFDKTYCTTYALVDSEIREQLDSVIRYNSYYFTMPPYYDPSKITFWPRRADGSMDYPLPLNMPNYTATHRTLDNLRLRDTANTTAKLVTTLPKGTEVQVIETGLAATIDGINATWVRVISGNGYTGWCFGGYLEEIKKPDMGNNGIENQGTDIGAGVAGDQSQGNEVTQNGNEPETMPLWVWLAIIGGAVVLAGGVVLFIVKRKK